ncbi:MAG: hypothetical protein MR697_00575, partial [Clostridiales bacterium]|nr:hypothetical protein [Clostridiales bacterium]
MDLRRTKGFPSYRGRHGQSKSPPQGGLLVWGCMGMRGRRYFAALAAFLAAFSRSRREMNRA